jgi:hypothetical protein
MSVIRASATRIGCSKKENPPNNKERSYFGNLRSFAMQILQGLRVVIFSDILILA